MLPWVQLAVVGARGLIQKHTMCSTLDFLIPHREWQQISVQATVTGLSFMHRVRFSNPIASQDSGGSNHRARFKFYGHKSCSCA